MGPELVRCGHAGSFDAQIHPIPYVNTCGQATIKVGLLLCHPVGVGSPSLRCPDGRVDLRILILVITSNVAKVSVCCECFAVQSH